jgi:hypothetical protein
VAYRQTPAHSMGIRLNKETATNPDVTIKQQLLEEYEQYINQIDEELLKTNSLLKGSESPPLSKSLIVEYLLQKHKTKGGDVMHSVNYVMKSSPQVSILRRTCSDFWGKRDKTPGPAAYDNSKFSSVRKSAPKFSIAQARLKLNASVSCGPFSAF